MEAKNARATAQPSESVLPLDTINEDESGELTSRVASSRHHKHSPSDVPKGSCGPILLDFGHEGDEDLLTGLNEMSEPVVDFSMRSKSPRIDNLIPPPERVVSTRSIASMAVAKTHNEYAQAMPSNCSVKV